jgi:hypothetical protein
MQTTNKQGVLVMTGAGCLKALCLVLVISDDAQVLIICLRLFVANDD